MKILIAEDDPINYTILGNLLKNYGDCKIVTNGVSALNAYAKAFREEDPYDVLFLDLNMPKMEGGEVLEKIRIFEHKQGIYDESNQLKVIIATAIDQHDTVMKSFKQGCQDYFLKPYNPQELDDLMESMGYGKQWKGF